MEVLDVLKKCTVQGLVVKLPGQLDRKLYLQVQNHLEKIGGKWNKKHQGFLFPKDPALLLTEQANGANRNLKKEGQAYFTPPELAMKAAALLQVQKRDRVLEPSAGDGRLVRAVFTEYPFLKQIDCCEINEQYEEELRLIDGVLIIGNDFLTLEETIFGNHYDKIIANPPFTKNQDIDHIYHMYKMLKPGGRIVSFASIHWQEADDRFKKEKEFRQWLKEVNAKIKNLKDGEFRKSGTMVDTCYIIIDKPKAK